MFYIALHKLFVLELRKQHLAKMELVSSDNISTKYRSCVDNTKYLTTSCTSIVFNTVKA